MIRDIGRRRRRPWTPLILLEPSKVGHQIVRSHGSTKKISRPRPCHKGRRTAETMVVAIEEILIADIVKDYTRRTANAHQQDSESISIA